MIFRKPYAFLIRNFRKINLILLLLCVYVLTQTLTLVNLTKSYIGYGSTLVLDQILSSFHTVYFVSIFLVLIGTLIVIYLLYRKEKPIKTYLIIFGEYLLLLIFSLIANRYYQNIWLEGFDKAMARNMNGFFFILSLPQYIILLLLVIRTMGLDLNSFGFRHDREISEDEEDREEVEVELVFNKDKWIRKMNYFIRQGKYFFKQNKFYITLFSVFILIIGSFVVYREVYVINKVYMQGEVLSSNYYQFQVNNTYITTKDYKGDEIGKNKSYVIIDLDVVNSYISPRVLDIDKFMLMVDDKMYMPSVEFNQYFNDLGPVFKHQTIEGGKKYNYFLIFEIDKPEAKSNFKLRYQDTLKSKLIQIKLKIKDISAFVLRDTKKVSEVQEVMINKDEYKHLQITYYEIGDRYTYTYESCYINTCPIYEAEVRASNDRKILYLKINPLESTTKEILSFMLKYGKIKYKIGEVEYQENVVSSIKKTYKGNFILLDIPNLENVDEMLLVFTIRNNQYVYQLR